MDVRSLAEWHKVQASRAADRSQLIHGKVCTKTEFHLRAAELVETLSGNERDRSLIEIEKEVKQRAIQSLERLAKSLTVEARELRRMLADEVGDD